MLNIKKSKLEFIESTANEQTFLKAEELLDRQKVSEASIEKNKSSYTVQDKGDHQVSITNKNNGTYAISCSCDEKEECSHKIAALLRFRSAKLHDKITRQKKQRNTRPRGKKAIDITTILDHLSAEELKIFITNYAKKDRKLATSIKTKFAHRLDVADNKLKYKQILDSIVPPVVSREASLKRAELRQFSNALEDFTEQSNDKIALNLYLDAYEIITVLSYKWEYLKSKFEINIEDIIENQKKIYDVWLNLSNVTIAPNLASDIKEDLVSIISSSFFTPISNKYNVSEILWLFAHKDAKIKQEVLDVLNEGLPKIQQNNQAAKLMAIAIKYGDELDENIEQLLLDKVNVVQDLIEQLLEIRAFDKAKLVTDLILQKAPNAKNIKALEIEVLIGVKKYQEAIAKCIDYIVTFKNHRQYKTTKEKLPVEYKHMLIEQAKKDNSLNSPVYEGLFYMILFVEEEWEYMLNKLDQSFSLRAAHKYANYLDNIDQDRHAQLYIKHLEVYLEDHLGQQASDYVYELIDGLRDHKLYETIGDIMEYLEKAYPLRVPKF